MAQAHSSLDLQAVLGHFGVASTATVELLRHHSGFSGAQVYRIEDRSKSLRLKAWPQQNFSEKQLRWMHQLMRRARVHDHDWVPEVLETRDRTTLVKQSGWFWDLTDWMAGTPETHLPPSPARLQNALQTLGQIHEAWAEFKVEQGPCPSLGRRQSALADWLALAQSGWKLNADRISEPRLRFLLVRAQDLVDRHLAAVPEALALWMNRLMPRQPCIGDIWHDHVLFEEDRVSGIIDFGGVRIDHVAADIGRLLGSMVGDDDQGWALGLTAYRRARPLSRDEESLARLLDRTGAVIGLTNWLRWLGRGEKHFNDNDRAVERLRSLVERIEAWPT